MIKKFISAYIMFAIFLCISPNQSMGEEPFVEWIVSGTASNSKGAKIAIDDYGNIYRTVAGWTSKYDTNGNTLWTESYVMEGSILHYNNAVNIALDSSNNVYVSAGGDGFIKYNKAGKQLWFQKYGNYGSSSALALAVDASGNSYVSGSGENYNKTVKYDTNGNILWEADNETLGLKKRITLDNAGNVYISAGPYGGELVKFNNLGVKQWVHSYGDTLVDIHEITVDEAGNVYLVGTSLYSNTMVTVKHDTYGKLLWINEYNGPNVDQGNDIAVDNAGNVYVTGQSMPNIVTIKYDPSGKEQWVNIVEGGEGGAGKAIAVDSKGNVYASGYTIDYTLGSYKYSPTTVKYDNCGNELWVHKISYNDYEAVDNALDKEGNLFVLGKKSDLAKYGYALEDNLLCAITADETTNTADETTNTADETTNTADNNTKETISFYELSRSIDEMIETSCIENKGIANAIQASLSNAINSNNEKASINMLEALLNKISAQSGKGVCFDGAEKLIADINKLIFR